MLWVFAGGIVAAVIAVSIAHSIADWPAAEVDLTDAQKVLRAGISAAAQFGAFAVLLWLLLRAKGGGVLRDLGVLADREWGWIVVSFLGGIGLQIALGLTVLPLTELNDDRKQELLDQLDAGSGVGIALLAVAAAVLAPVLEELLFRGVLLRALLRRMPAVPAVATSAVVFGVTHLADLDAAAALPALVGFGLISGVLAVRSGGLLRSIALHAGFNALTVLVTIAMITIG